MERRLETTEASLASAEGREAQRAEELSKAREDLAIKDEETQILQDRYVDVYIFCLERYAWLAGRKAA